MHWNRRRLCICGKRPCCKKSGRRRTGKRLDLQYTLFARPEAVDGAKLFELAEAGSDEAAKVFAAFGENVSEALTPFLKSFRPQGLVLGGQIAKSFPHFGMQLREVCRLTGTAVFTEPDTSIRAMEGLYAVMEPVTGAK